MAPLSQVEHPYIVRSIVPLNRSSQGALDYKGTHVFKLDIPVEPGERVGICHIGELGFAVANTWQEFDVVNFSYLVGVDQNVENISVGEKLGDLSVETLRPALRFSMQML